MKLANLLSNDRYRLLQGSIDTEVKGISCNSLKIKPGYIFVCIRGESLDGNRFIKDSIDGGACTIVTDSIPEEEIRENVTVIKVDNARASLAQISAAYYGNPAEQLITIGITGTKGKTSTAFMLHAVLNEAGMKTGLISTVFIDNGKERRSSTMTTPDASDIQKALREMVVNDCKAAVIEVSSQAMKLDRVAGIVFDFAVFTNLGEDHIGPKEHTDFQEYLECKSRLFRQSRHAVVNGDDRNMEKVMEGHTCTIATFGYETDNDYVLSLRELWRENGKLGVSFEIEKEVYNVPLAGRFTPLNAAPAIIIGGWLGAGSDAIHAALESIGIPGRQECFSITGKEVIMVDYAHNGMALEALMQSLKDYRPSKITCVFGCGGERDPKRRTDMGRAACKYADDIILTADNPRNECPNQIFSDIIKGINNAAYSIVPDRREAIYRAVAGCGPGQFVLIAGKGHENYQITGDKRVHLDDREEVLLSIEKVRK